MEGRVEWRGRVEGVTGGRGGWSEEGQATLICEFTVEQNKQAVKAMQL